MNKIYPFMTSPRCGAKTRYGHPCRSPSVKQKSRCRMHGGTKGSGAQKGNRNALKHGYTTQCSKNERQLIRRLLKATLDPFS